MLWTKHVVEVMQLKDVLFSSLQWRGSECIVWSRWIGGLVVKMREQRYSSLQIRACDRFYYAYCEMNEYVLPVLCHVMLESRGYIY